MIRNLENMVYSFSTSDPSRSGYQFSTLNANLDALGNGPARATWSDYSFTGELRMTGKMVGKFEAKMLDAHVVGLTTAGEHYTAHFLPYDTAMGNVVGEFMTTPN